MGRGRNDHTMTTAPHPVRSAKLSSKKMFRHIKIIGQAMQAQVPDPNAEVPTQMEKNMSDQHI
jgi:hypothetical protein